MMIVSFACSLDLVLLRQQASSQQCLPACSAESFLNVKHAV